MIPGPVRMRPLVTGSMKTKPSKTQIFLWKFIAIIHSMIYHYQKPKRVTLRRKRHWGSWSSSGSRLITLSLGFTVTRVLFRFLIDRILFSVLSDRVFFESTEIGSSSLGDAVIDYSLHQSCSFSAMSLVFIKSCYYFFFIKNRCFVLHSLKFSKIISLTCFNNFSKKLKLPKKWRNTS